MNNSKPWNQKSPGFMYYVDATASTPNNTSVNTDTSGNIDFIEFSNKNSPKGQFSPGNYSSPTHNKSNDFRGRGHFNRGRQNYDNSRQSYNNSKQYLRHSMNSSMNSTFNSFNNSRPSPYGRPKFDKDDISQYVDRSMLEDPWAELEKKLDCTKQNDSDTEKDEINALNMLNSDKDTQNSQYSQCESADSQDDSQVSSQESS